jgi:4,5-dihydroxyphthalate decarboxylase
MEQVVDHVATGLITIEAMEALQTPLYRHGTAANRAILETCAQYSHEQGLTPRVMTIEELFAASTLEQ